MNYPPQPCFRTWSVRTGAWSGRIHFTAIFAAFGVASLVVLAGVWSPNDVRIHFASSLEPIGRVFVYAVSIVLEAAPFVLAGSVASSVVARLNAGGVLAAIAAAVSPGCDCAMNGFASALHRCRPAVAGMALTWGAVCNPAALIATAAVLGSHLLVARVVGGAAAAVAVGLLWSRVEVRACAGRHNHESSSGVACEPARDLASGVEHGLRLLLPAAFLASAAIVFVPDGWRAHIGPVGSAIAAAVLSPCSTADAIVAKVLVSSASAQAIFIVAGQCVDARQLVLLGRHFGVRAAGLAAAAGAAGCAAAALIAR